MVRIGHASLNELGHTTGGQKGDQKNEVCIRTWYNKPWSYLLRPKDHVKAEIMATNCEIICNNSACGYDQSTRNSLRQEAIKTNFDFTKIGLCNCDCSSFMSVCAESAGIAIPYSYGNAPTTKTMQQAFMSTGEFDLYTDYSHLNSPNFLKRGDILVKEGSHTVMALDTGTLANNVQNMKDSDNAFAIDISANQGNINFAKVKESGISKVILRSTTKNYQPDTKWYEYLKGCDDNKIEVECYRYSYATTVEQSISEANNVLSLLNGRKMFIWLDLENKAQRTAIGKQGITSVAVAFLTTCEDAGYKCGIYCNLDWYNNCIDDSLKSKYKFWIARYPKEDTGQIVNPLKPNVGEVMWQYTSKGRIGGINGDVDIDMICYSYNTSQGQIGASTGVTKPIVINNIVNASILNVRSHPALFAPIKYTLSRNEKVKIYGYFLGWYAINNSLDEWVSAEYILTTKGVITATKLHYRKDAGKEFDSLGQFINGEVVNILNQKTTKDGKIWYLCVDLLNNSFGWASSEYIKSL